MTSRLYITICGRSGWALLNAYHAAHRECGYIPDETIIIAEESQRHRIPAIQEGCRLISNRHGGSSSIRCDFIHDGDIPGTARTVRQIATAHAGEMRALDITPARKALAAAALIALVSAGISLDHIFYLSLADYPHANRPYMMIPRLRQRMVDITTEAIA